MFSLNKLKITVIPLLLLLMLVANLFAGLTPASAATNIFTGKPIRFAINPADKLPKLPLGTQNTTGFVFPLRFSSAKALK